MTVKELIKELSKFDSNLEVMVPHEDGHDYVEEAFSVSEILLLEDGSGEWIFFEDKKDMDNPREWKQKVLRIG